jgi:hypothetical protein
LPVLHCNTYYVHRCAQLKWIMPDWFPTKWVSLFTQPWEGDITLVLPSHMWNVGKSIVNPTSADIMSATRQVGQTGMHTTVLPVHYHSHCCRSISGLALSGASILTLFCACTSTRD